MIELDTSTWSLQRQVEIRRPSAEGYYFDVIWVKPELGKKNAVLKDNQGSTWTVHEVFGTRKMPGQRSVYQGTI